MRVCQPCRVVIDSGEYERDIIQRHSQRVAEVHSLVHGHEPVPAEVLVKENNFAAASATEDVIATAVPAPAEVLTCDEDVPEENNSQQLLLPQHDRDGETHGGADGRQY